jgi:hypothetical protein
MTVSKFSEPLSIGAYFVRTSTRRYIHMYFMIVKAAF